MPQKKYCYQENILDIQDSMSITLIISNNSYLLADTQFSGSHFTLFVSQCSHRFKSISPACGAGYTGSRSQSLLHHPPKLSEGNKTKTRQSVFSDPRVCLRGLVSGWRHRAAPPAYSSHPFTSTQPCMHKCTHMYPNTPAQCKVYTCIHTPWMHVYTQRHICTHCTHTYTHADTHMRGHGGLAKGVGEAMTTQGGPLRL